MKINSDFTKILSKKLEKKWVALSMDHKKVIGSSDNLAALEKKIGHKEVVYMKVMPSDREYAF